MSFLTSRSFIFNGINSNDYGITIGWINSSDVDVSENGLNRELKKTSNSNKLKSYVYGTENTDPIIFNFSIFKRDESEISRIESIRINQWLMTSSVPQILKFNDYDTYPLHYYAVCTQINDIIVAGRLIGKELTFETNSPFAFSNKTEKIFDIDGSKTFSLNNSADTDNGIFYPIITISTKSENIVIENITDKKSVTINTEKIETDINENKVITINSENMTVKDINGKLIPVDKLGWNETYKSYVSSTDTYMENIYWIRLLNGTNSIKVEGTCQLKIEYEFPRKAGCL